MWLNEQLLGRGIEIALLGASADRDDREASDTEPIPAPAAAREKR